MEESNGIVEAAMPEEARRHGIASEDGRSGALLEGVKSGNGGGGVEITGAEEGLDLVVKREAGADKSGGGIGEAGVTRGWRIGTRSESMERGFYAEASLAAASLGCSFLGRGEGEEASGD